VANTLAYQNELLQLKFSGTVFTTVYFLHDIQIGTIS